MRCNLRWLSACFGVLLLLVLTVPYLIPTTQYRNQIETILSDATGYNAHIDSVGFNLFPTPEIKLTKLRITRPVEPSTTAENTTIDTEELVAESAHIPFVLDSLLEGNIVITRLKLNNLLADQALLTEFIGSLGSSENEQASGDEQKANTDEDSSFELHLVEITSLKLRREKGAIIGPYHLLVFPDMKTGFSKITLSREDGTANMEASKEGENIYFHMFAENWVSPLGFPVEITSLATSGVLSGSQLTLYNIDTNIFDGRLTGKGDLSWEKDWKSSGEVKSKGINLSKALQSFDDKTISGNLDADCKFSLKAKQADILLENPVLSCQYHIADGEFYKADLENAASIGSSKEEGSSTPFDELSGKVVLSNRNIEITDINLISTALQVNGAVKVQKYNNLNGRVEVGLKKTASLTSVPLKISGTLDDPKFRPTNGAIAGATIGTVLLGPGIGTAIGVNISKGIHKIFGLFKSDDDDESDTEP